MCVTIKDGGQRRGEGDKSLSTPPSTRIILNERYGQTGFSPSTFCGQPTNRPWQLGCWHGAQPGKAVCRFHSSGPSPIGYDSARLRSGHETLCTVRLQPRPRENFGLCVRRGKVAAGICSAVQEQTQATDRRYKHQVAWACGATLHRDGQTWKAVIQVENCLVLKRHGLDVFYTGCPRAFPGVNPPTGIRTQKMTSHVFQPSSSCPLTNGSNGAQP